MPQRKTDPIPGDARLLSGPTRPESPFGSFLNLRTP
jgi:hypothetical protein